MGMTIRDIAKSCGVGVGTVSRAINNNGYVKKEVKEKILKCARENNWQASALASALKTGKTRTAAVFANTIKGYNNHIIVEEIAKNLRKKNYHTFISIIGFDGKEQKKELSSFVGRQLDAAAIIAPRLEAVGDEIKLLSKTGAHVILISEEKVPNCSLVTFNHEEQGFLAMQHLINKGHRKIMHIGALGKNIKAGSISDYDKYPTPQKILKGAVEAAKKANIGFDISSDVMSDNYGDYSHIEKVILEKKYSALICGSQPITKNIYMIAQKHKIKIPDELSFVCVGNNEFIDAFTPTPTLVDIHQSKLGETVAKLISDKEINLSEIYIAPKLIEGGSVKDISKT